MRPASGSIRVALGRRRSAAQRWATVAIVAALTAGLWTGPARGQTGRAEVVPARVFAGWLVYRDHTEIDQLAVWNAEPGQRIGVECHWGEHHRCPSSGRRDSLMAVRVGPSGFVDLTPRFRRVRLEPFSRLSSDHLTIFLGDRNYNFDPDSDAYNGQRGRYPTLVKTVTYWPKKKTLPRRERACDLLLGPDVLYEDPDSYYFYCDAPCPPPPHLQFSDYCVGAGQALPLPRFTFASRAVRRGGVRITRLGVSGLSFPPPYRNPAIAVFCHGPRRVAVRGPLRGCPFGARFFARPRGGVQRIESFGRQVLRPGIVIEIWIVKGNYIGRVQRLVVERRRLAASSRCIHPTRVRSHACPPGS